VRADQPGADRCRPAGDRGLGTHAAVVANRPGNGSPFSAAKNPSTNTSGDLHTRIFGLLLVALLVGRPVLNAACPPTRICQQANGDIGTTGTDLLSAQTRIVHGLGGGSQAAPFGTMRSKNQGSQEPGD
jgi:hypothetical protein